MSWQLPRFVVALYAVVLVGVATLFYIWRRRQAPAAMVLFWLGAAMMEWALTDALMLTATGRDLKLLFMTIGRIGMCAVPLLWFLFALAYSGYNRLPRYWLAALAVVPVATVIIAATNGLHGWMWRSVTLDKDGDLAFLAVTWGPWFWVNLVYSYILLALSPIVLVRAIWKSPPLYLYQTVLLIVGAALPVGGNLLYLGGRAPLAHVDLTPYLMIASAVAVSFGILRLRLLDLVPVARGIVVDRMADAVLVFDASNRVVDLNPSAALLVDAPDSAVGRPVDAVFQDRPDLSERLRAGEAEDAEVSIRGRDYALRSSTITNRRGGVSGRVVVLHDITQRKRAEMERERLIDDLDAYARAVAHDLKNPIGVISGCVELLEMGLQHKPSEPEQEFLAVIGRGCEKMTQIINELLLLASVRKSSDIAVDSLDMAEIVGEALERLSGMIEKSKAEVILPEKWPSASGHGAWVEEIWANYISNALKYGGAPPRLELGASDDGNGRVHFWVRDNGLGLNEEAVRQLFREFSRVAPGKVEGHGLGLSIVKRIVEKLDGEVRVSSKPGEGSTFGFTLPTNAVRRA